MLNKKNIYLLAFIIWVVLSFSFILRDLFYKKYSEYYKTLLLRNAYGKSSYIYGDYFFEYLNFCKKNIPVSATYGLIGIESLSLDDRRAVYYLYPRIKSGEGDYLLVFDQPGYRQDGYRLFKEIDNRRFILERDRR